MENFVRVVRDPTLNKWDPACPRRDEKRSGFM